MDFNMKGFENAEEIRKNGRENIKVFRHEYLGTPLITIRLFNRIGFPLPKGISLQPRHWREVLPLLEKLLDEAGEEGDPF